MKGHVFQITDWMREERLRREALFEGLFGGKPIPHIPIEIKVSAPKHRARDYYFDFSAQFEDAMSSAVATWGMKRNDLIPSLFPDVGCSCLATVFGARYYFGESEDQTAGVKDPPIKDLAGWAAKAGSSDTPGIPDIMESEWIREGLRRTREFAEAGDGFLPVTGLDAAGGVNVAADLLGVQNLLMAMVMEKEALHRLLAVIQETYIALIEKEIEAAGGLDNMTCTDFYPGWSPPGYKGHCSDDISAMFGPDFYDEFSAPYHAMVYRKYGRGGLHNCGPNPCHEAYVAHEASPRYLDLAEKYSERDLPKLKKSLKGKAFIRWGSEDREIGLIEKRFRGYMELLAPDVMLVPAYTVTTQEEGDELYDRLYPIAVEYAGRMEFGFGAGPEKLPDGAWAG